MRINGSGKPPVLGSKGASLRADTESARGARKRKPGASVVSLGDAAARAVRGGGRVDSAIRARLEDVRAQLANGDYAVDFDKLAERILDDEVARTGSRP